VNYTPSGDTNAPAEWTTHPVVELTPLQSGAHVPGGRFTVPADLNWRAPAHHGSQMRYLKAFSVRNSGLFCDFFTFVELLRDLLGLLHIYIDQIRLAENFAKCGPQPPRVVFVDCRI